METIGDIIAEMREYNESTNPPWVCFNEDGGVNITNLIDRIEAAVVQENRTCQESQQVGDTAKMRNALELVRLYISHGPEKESRAYVKNGQIEMLHAIDVLNAISSALSATPRNCDLYKSEPEAYQAYLTAMKNATKKTYVYFEPWLFEKAKGEMK